VGDPVKIREKLEPTELEALTPQMIRTVPPMRSASEASLFMVIVV
jgi:hypothetical protein